MQSVTEEERLYDPAIETAKTLVNTKGGRPSPSEFPWMAEAEGMTAVPEPPQRREPGIYALPPKSTGEKVGEFIARGVLPFYSQIKGEAPWLSTETAMEIPSRIAYGALGTAVLKPIIGKLGNWFRFLTNQERGLVTQSLDDMIAKGYSEGEILKRWGNPEFRVQALSRRMPTELPFMKGEGTVPSPKPTEISPIPRLPAIRPATEPVPTPLPIGMRPPIAETRELPLFEPAREALEPIQKMRKIESGVARMSPSEWSKNPELVSEAKLAAEKTGISPENLEYVGLQKFTPYSNDAMHLWNVTDPSSPKYGSTVAGPTFQLTEGQTKRLRPMGVLKSQRGSLGEVNAPIWYSTLQRTIETKMPNQAPIEQVMNIVKGAGVKADEIKWSGLDDFLSKKTGKIGKQELVDYLKENQVEIKEIVKGGPTSVSDDFRIWLQREHMNPQTPEEFVSLSERLERTAKQWQANGDQRQARRYFDMSDEATKLSEGINLETGSTIGQTKFSQWQLPGGESYRELLLTLPGELSKESISQRMFGKPYKQLTDQERFQITPEFQKQMKETYRAPHWDEPNVLAHVRFNDRVDPEGKKVLFIEEVQSDWHQAGREKGYGRKQFTEEQIEIIASENGKSFKAIDKNTKEEITTWVPTKDQAMRVALKASGEGVPFAPFSKTWHELMMKRMVRWASEKGYDKIAWTTGEQQAERYDLSKHISKIEYDSIDGELWGYDLQGKQVIEEIVKPERLEDYIGKEAAKKILEAPTYGDTHVHTLKGIDLKVGGEGMKGFYDKILPEYMNKFGKKWGAKVGETNIVTGRGIDRQIEGGGFEFIGPEHPEAPKQFTTVHSLDITPSMKKSVLEEGLPLFQLLPLAGAGAGGLTYMGKKESEKSKQNVIRSQK